jgi:hypothetical protein
MYKKISLLVILSVVISLVASILVFAGSKKKIVFVSSAKYTGNLGGVAGAAAKCQQLAEAAGLPGNYKAWLSDKTSSPAATFTRWNGPYVLVDGTEVASKWEGLTEDFHLAPITITETGQDTGESLVWTNTSASGGPGPCPCPAILRDAGTPHEERRPAVRDGSCQNWTSSNADLYDGLCGNSIAQTKSWTFAIGSATHSQVADCDELLRLYCFEQ